MPKAPGSMSNIAKERERKKEQGEREHGVDEAEGHLQAGMLGQGARWQRPDQN